MNPLCQPHGTLREFRGVSHVLLDIEGTTCPVNFVADTLFPYASEHLKEFLRSRGDDPAVKALTLEVERAWRSDPDPQAKALWQQRAGGASSAAPDAVLPYLQWLIRLDRKQTTLKELQGLVWAEGYGSGELRAPLFADVADRLRKWRAEGKVLAVYSSGSVTAQQLLYNFSNGGDLRPLFAHWFDTHIGTKHECASYLSIASALNVPPASILFVSDAVAELDAAAEAEMQVVFSDRVGNPQRGPGSHPSITSLEQILLIG
jgi:enolase-phosphatase E1